MAYGVINSDLMTTSDGVSSAGLYGMKNRIINGGMQIDQRNAGASITPVTAQYTVDRWQCALTAASKYSVQQNAGSVTPPAGFITYLGITSLSSYSILTGDSFRIQQPIEGSNIADLAWGTASAASVTLSFWVRSSLTGTFGGALQNSGGNRSYPFTYTISAANTWEQKSVTIAGDTTGTWLTTNGVGVYVILSLGTGATYSGTAGAWAGANYFTAPGATSLVGTSGATLLITGVQLERGSVSTSFDFRDYGREFMLCQRYCRTLVNGSAVGVTWNTTSSSLISFGVPMRVTPTISTTSGFTTLTSSNIALTGIAVSTFGQDGSVYLGCTVASGYAAGGACILSAAPTNANLSAEF